MRLLTLHQAADRLTLSWKTVYALVTTGKMRGVRLTDSKRAPWRVDENEIDRYLASLNPSVPTPSRTRTRVHAVDDASERAALGLPERGEFT